MYDGRVFSPVPEILDELRAGRMIVLVDDEDRENEGDLLIAAEHATAEKINFMLRMAGGYLFMTLTEGDCDRLALGPQAPQNTSVRGTPFTVSVDGHPRHGVSTGVSAPDRAKTISLIIDPRTRPEDLVRPGHINPLRSRDGGVLVRIGHTEGAVDLCRLAGLYPAAVGIEIVREDGEMARRADLEKLCAKHSLKMCTIEQLIAHRLRRESLVKRMAPAGGTPIETEAGPFTLYAYESVVDALPHVVLSVGGVGATDDSGRVIPSVAPTLVRMHRRHLLGDVFGELTSSKEGPTSRVLRASMEQIQREGRGAIVYLRPEGHGPSLNERLLARRRVSAGRADAHDLTSPEGPGADAMPMHLREFGIGGQILRDLGLSRLRLLTNHPRALPALDGFGLEIVEHVPLGFDEV